ncbi:two-component system, OmpR family, phosphate regulon sensor histidine kinase PhoR [Sphingomonas gellani]|uniref:histidine kinase n=1 Tax=Sphingomonas gellani TaxID=1166340 RepID=A0A1H8FWY7_9SPHN|nr:ATP-binding protein [Sphingomonas gellani]SEN36054.1 two-component system, OmpR family, phosphate regulon sensor histidine kinase PhoR [Sphingomonas gellani]
MLMSSLLIGFGPRARWGLVVAILTALAVPLVGGSVDVAAVVLVGGAAAALAAAGPIEPAEAPVPIVTQASIMLPEVLDAIAEPVLIVGDGRIAAANRAARDALGQHIVGEDPRLAIRHPAAADLISAGNAGEAVELAGLGGIDQRWEMRMGETADARRIVHLRDRTAQHAAERMRVDFVANASHELRTPLASILGFVETLQHEAGEDPPTRGRFLKIMGDEAARMQRLVGDLISLSRIEADKHRPPSGTIDLAPLVTEVAAELRRTRDGRGSDLVTSVDPLLPPVVGDRPQLSQLLHNLMGNALKYGRAGTPVDVSLARDGAAGVRLTVADQGEGIAAEHLPRLTERFYRVDAGRSRSVGGTGLGLAICKHIVERHRGRLRIASRVGEGTTVTVTLPVAPPAALS